MESSTIDAGYRWKKKKEKKLIILIGLWHSGKFLFDDGGCGSGNKNDRKLCSVVLWKKRKIFLSIITVVVIFMAQNDDDDDNVCNNNSGNKHSNLYSYSFSGPLF